MSEGRCLPKSVVNSLTLDIDVSGDRGTNGDIGDLLSALAFAYKSSFRFIGMTINIWLAKGIDHYILHKDLVEFELFKQRYPYMLSDNQFSLNIK